MKLEAFLVVGKFIAGELHTQLLCVGIELPL